MGTKTKVSASIAGMLTLGILVGGAGCTSDAQQADENLSTEAEQFRVPRDIVFYNGITDKFIAEVKGYCSVAKQGGVPGSTLSVTCRVGPNQYTKDYMGLSDNTTWFMRQLQPVDVSLYHREIILKPENVIPDVTFEGGKQ